MNLVFQVAPIVMPLIQMVLVWYVLWQLGNVLREYAAVLKSRQTMRILPLTMYSNRVKPINWQLIGWSIALAMSWGLLLCLFIIESRK